MSPSVSVGEFEFECGESVPDLEIAYEEYGEFTGDNAVLVCHALTGSQHVAGRRRREDTAGQAAAWWDDIVGPGKAIDTNEYYVVCANVPGSCYGSSGPPSEAPDGEPWGTRFPAVTVGDWTRAQRRLLDELGVPTLHGVVGGSVGGMNALEWAKRYPDGVERVMAVATGARLDPQCLALDAIARRAITTDPEWRDGEYYDEFLEFYRTIDEYLGELRAALADDVTLVVASDHGFTTLDYEFYANEWLRREGWLSYQDDDHDSLTDIAAETRAYAFVPGRFYINLEDREPRGSVPKSEYERVRDELTEKLQALEGPDGEPVVDRVVPKEEAFHGGHDDIAPDLVAIPNHGFDLKAGFKPKDALFGKDKRNGMHSFDNASLLIDDPDLSVDDTVDLFDLAPTMMDLMELDYDPAGMEGQSLVSK